LSAFARSFPYHIANIERRRSCDPVFAEICRDYELLMGLLPVDAVDPAASDIRNSLAGLELEIWSCLGAAPAPSAQPLRR